jgi:cyclopropane fatty-acyl-phospholipid synthase-like methyltransferase
MKQSSFGPRGTEEFEDAYKAAPPWDIGQPQAAFKRIAEAGALRGKVLDVGCGTGELALMAAELGLPAVGVDESQTAIAMAQRKALERGLNADFKVWSALQLVQLGQKFDTLLDCGLFHVLSDPERVAYVASLAHAAQPGANFRMLCFSDRQSGTFGPRRVSKSEIEACFIEGWQIESIEPSLFVTTNLPGGAQAWMAAIKRS